MNFVVHKRKKHRGWRPQTSGRVESPMIQVGDTFGELTVEKQLPSEHGNRRWFCRCDCGGEAIRTTSALLASRRNNQNPCCARCLQELRQGLWIEHTTISADRFKRLWLDRGELWTNQALDWIENDIREEVGLELGGWREGLDSVSGAPWDFGPDPEHPVDDDLPSLKEIGKYLPFTAQTQTEISAVPGEGISNERVRQIEARALRKLQTSSWTGHYTLKRFHEDGIPKGVEGLDVAHDSYIEPEPIVRFDGLTMDKALARAIVGKKNDQRPAWCPQGDNPEDVPPKHRQEHMALIDAAIVRAQVWEERRRELLLREKMGQAVGAWEWWGIPGTMRLETMQQPPSTGATPLGPPPQPVLINGEWMLLSSEQPKTKPDLPKKLEYDYQWSWYRPTVKPLFFIPVPPIVPPVPRHLTGIAKWIDQQVKEKR